MHYPKDGDVCPLCEKGILQSVVKDVKFEYKTHTITLKGETVLVCDTCGYESLNPETNKTIDKRLSDFRHSVDKLWKK